MVLWGYEICRRDIPGYLTERAVAAVRVWERFKQYGLPFAGGWAEQPAVYMDLIELFEAELAKRKAAQRGGK
jgi:hypothetical protein